MSLQPFERIITVGAVAVLCGIYLLNAVAAFLAPRWWVRRSWSLRGILSEETIEDTSTRMQVRLMGLIMTIAACWFFPSLLQTVATGFREKLTEGAPPSGASDQWFIRVFNFAAGVGLGVGGILMLFSPTRWLRSRWGGRHLFAEEDLADPTRKVYMRALGFVLGIAGCYLVVRSGIDIITLAGWQPR